MWARSFAADPCTKFEMANDVVINPVDASRQQVRGTSADNVEYTKYALHATNIMQTVKMYIMIMIN